MYTNNLTFNTIKKKEPNKEHIHNCFVLFLPKEKCWCTQNYLWDVWWKCYSH